MRTSPQTVSITSSIFPNTKMTLILYVAMMGWKKVVKIGETQKKLYIAKREQVTKSESAFHSEMYARTFILRTQTISPKWIELNLQVSN